MDTEVVVFRNLVLWLWRTHEKPWEYSQYVADLIVQNYLEVNTSFSRSEELERALPSEENVSGDFGGRFLYLNPVTEGRLMVPRLHMRYDFGRNTPEIRCRLEMFLLDNENDLNLKSLGYRFESPEGQSNDTRGIHDYYHVQIIQPPTCRVEWLPETQPAFPIDANNSVTLLLSILISLYGLNYLKKLLSENEIWKLNDYLNGISYTRSYSFENYRLIRIGNPPRAEIGYRITSSLPEFQNHINNIYQGCQINSITKFAFDRLPPDQKRNFP